MGAERERERGRLTNHLVHPYYYLQNPEEKRELLDGLTALMRRINESNGNGNTGSPKDDGRNNNSVSERTSLCVLPYHSREGRRENTKENTMAMDGWMDGW